MQIGEHFAVVVYQYTHSWESMGGIELWRVVRQPNLDFVRTERAIEVPRGAHQVVAFP
jgi:hypothetical protein